MRKVPVSAYKNVVFDIGNVIVRWDPPLITARAFGAPRASDDLVRSIFGGDIWFRLNRGEISEAEAKQAYCARLGFSEDEAETLFFHIKDSLDLMEDTTCVMARLDKAGYRMFALSDNVREIVAHLQAKYDFWRYFEGAVISAELGALKPSPEIFAYLLNEYELVPEETVFLDDMQHNVDGAAAMGLRALRFSNAARAEQDLKGLGLVF